jgi:ribonuclease HII
MTGFTASFEIEDSFAEQGLIAGVDEAGRGPWAGPVVASAVILNRETMPEGLRDSKKLSEKRREELAGLLAKTAHIGVGLADVEEIDRLNIARATMLAMERAISDLPVQPGFAIIDGNMKPNLNMPTHTVIKGDAKSFSIAAASIIAKVTRDRMMRELALVHPFYQWERNKGYGVKAHRAGLEAHGITEHHRRSFAPVRIILEQAQVKNEI